MLLRLGNPTDRRIVTDIGCALSIRRAVLCNMAEEPLKILPVKKPNRVRVAIGPKKVVSIRLETAR